jgi:hypothetical protein
MGLKPVILWVMQLVHLQVHVIMNVIQQYSKSDIQMWKTTTMHTQHTHSCLQSIVAIKVCNVKVTISCTHTDTSARILPCLQTQLLKSYVSIATKYFHMDWHLSTSTSKSCLSVTSMKGWSGEEGLMAHCCNNHWQNFTVPR